MYKASVVYFSTMASFRQRADSLMTDTKHMLLLMQAMFLMPGKLHVLRKDTTNEHHSVKTGLSFSIMKSLMKIMGYQL